MNTKTKRTLLISTIIILLIINISALSTIVYNNKARTKKLAEISKVQDEMREMGMKRFFKEELNLTENQIIELHKINTKYSELTQNIAQNLSKKRYEMIIEVAKVNPDLKKLDNIAGEVGNMHYELKKLTINHFIELKEICNEEQQELLNKMFFRMLSNQDSEHMEHGHRRRNRDGSNKQPRHRKNRNNN